MWGRTGSKRRRHASRVLAALCVLCTSVGTRTSIIFMQSVLRTENMQRTWSAVSSRTGPAAHDIELSARG